jgi:hypothetical protein
MKGCILKNNAASNNRIRFMEIKNRFLRWIDKKKSPGGTEKRSILSFFVEVECPIFNKSNI